MLPAMDSCYGIFRPHQYGMASKMAQDPTENNKSNAC